MAERPLTVQDVCDHIAYLEYTCARLRHQLDEANKRAEKAEVLVVQAAKENNHG